MPKTNIDKAMETMIVKRAYTVNDFKAETRAEGEKRGVVGHAAVFDQMTNICGWFNEVIERGAFDEADLTDVLFFVNHDLQKIPLARSRRNNGNSTMLLSIDQIGLLVDADVDTENNTEARSLYSSISRGDMDGMSFMFRIKEDKWENLDTDMPTRRILKIAKVFEVSAVNMPAYVGTDISARDQAALDSARQALERAKELESSRSEVELLKAKIKLKLQGV
jgi:HK97 family phage prohead protease